MRKFSMTEYLANAGYSIFNYHRHNGLLHDTAENIGKYQLSGLKKLVSFAYHNIPLYNRKYKKAGIIPDDIKNIADFCLLPTVTKGEFLAGFPHDVIAKGFNIAKALASSTSGTTGKFLNILYDGKKVGTYIVAASRIYSMVMGYPPWYRHALIYTSPYPMSSLFGMYPVYFISNLEERKNIIKKLADINPHVITCYPSVLMEMTKLMTENDRQRIKPKAIFVNSEMSTKNERNFCGEYFKCEVYDEYSSEELTRIASQCKYKNYHLFEDICYTEILDPDSDKPLPSGETGEIVGTNMHNFAMPFIRYRQGDLGSIGSELCECGCNFRILESILGRKEDSFELPDGRMLSSGFLLDLGYALICELKEDIREYRIIQEKIERIKIEIVPGIAFNEGSKKKIENFFRKAVGGDVGIYVSVSERIPEKYSAQKRTIISLLKKRTER